MSYQESPENVPKKTVILKGVRFDMQGVLNRAAGAMMEQAKKLGTLTITGTWDPYEETKEDGTQP
jgi:hypothetical protein